MLMLKLRFNVALVFKKEALNENKYKELLEKIQLPCEAVLDNRIVMSPMLVFAQIRM